MCDLTNQNINKTYFQTANRLNRDGNLDEAIKLYEKATEVNPSFNWYYINLGKSLAKKGDFSQAINAYRKAINLKPSSAVSYHNLAELLIEQDNSGEALECYRQAVKLAPDLKFYKNKLNKVLDRITTKGEQSVVAAENLILSNKLNVNKEFVEQAMNNNKIKKIGIVGLSFHKLTGNPLETMLSNPVRSWALFSLLGAYNFETYLYVGNAEIELPIMEKYGERFIRDSREFVEKANTKFFDGLIIVGTKLHKTLIEHPWIKEIHKSKIFCAICADTYHELGGGRPLNFPPDITDQLVGMAFVSPYQKRLWDRRNSQIPSIVMTTGQIQKPENANESDGSVVFVGIFHNAEKLRDVAVMARIDRERTYHIISGVIGKANQLVNFHKLPPEKRQDNFRKLVLEQIDFDYPQNLLYHFLPPGSEAEILGRATVAIDFAWDWSLGIDASKVANYLTWGLCPVVENLQPSYRFLQRFNSGGIIPYGSSPAKWVEQIQKLAKTPLAIKNDLRKSAGSFFSWNNVAYEVGSFLRDHFDWAE